MTPLRGFILHDESIGMDSLTANDGGASSSSYTQKGARPGLPEPADPLSTYMPHAVHAQPADLDVIALRPGLPGEAGLGYRETGETASQYRGWNEPNLAQCYRPIEWGTAPTWFRADAVVCPASQKVVCAAADTSATEPISVWVWDPTTRDWSARDEPDASSTATRAALTVLRSTGRVLLFAADTGDGSAAVYYSDDDGANWAEYAPNAMVAGTLNASVSEVRMVEDRNGVLLLVALIGSTGQYWQYASKDRGASWEEVETSSSTLRSLSMSVLPGSVDPASPILVVYANAATSAAQSRSLADAYDPISGATEVAIDGTNAVGEVQVALDADGVAWVLLAEDDYIKVAKLENSAWTLYDEYLIQIGAGVASPTTHHHAVRACAWSAGELVAILTSAHTATTPTTDGSLVSLVCGGWSNLEASDESGTRDTRYSFADPGDTAGSSVWLPTETFANQGWTASGSAETLNGYHRFNPAAATSFARLTPNHINSTFTVLCEIQVVSGGSVSTGACSLSIERRDGANNRPLVIACSTTQFRVIDASGASTTLDTIDQDMSTEPVQFLIAYLTTSIVTVFYRPISSTLWTEAVSATLGSDATAATTDRFEVGCRASTTSDMRVGLFAIMHHDQLRTLSSSRRLRWGHEVSPIPYPVRDQVDDDGRMLHLSSGGGAARFQETWNIPAIYDYGVANTDPMRAPKPSAKWRSRNTSAQVLTWDLGVDSRIGDAWGIGLLLLGINFRTAILSASTDAAPTTFVELGTLRSNVVGEGEFSLVGDLLHPPGGALRGAHYFAPGSLKGGWVGLDNSDYRRIAWNEGGTWDGGGVQTAIELEGITGAEAASGDILICAPSAVLVVPLATKTQYRRIRLTIPSQVCPDDYFEMSKIVLGSIYAPGQQWSRGWSLRHVPIVRTEEDEAGTVYAEERTDEEVLRRELTVAWQDGTVLGPLRAQRARPVRRGSGLPIVTRGDVWHQLVGLLRRSKGGRVPAVALPEIPSASTSLTDPDRFIYGRLGVGQVLQINHVQGDEGRSEVVRIESLTLTELVG